MFALDSQNMGSTGSFGIMAESVVASAGAVRNHSQSLGVLMPEERLLLSTDNKSRETLQEISPEYLFTSSLNSFSSRRVQYISYICVLPFLVFPACHPGADRRP